MSLHHNSYVPVLFDFSLVKNEIQSNIGIINLRFYFTFI